MAVYYKPQSPIQSGEDFIYPITTADQVKVDKDTRLNAVGVYLKNIDNSTDTTVYGNNATTLGGVAAEDYALKTDTAPDSSKLGGKAPEYYIQPRNLLDNSDFTNPVNQRGIYSAVNGSYIIDRWNFYSSNFAGNVTITQSANGITVTNDAGADRVAIVQKIIDKNYYDGKYTAVAKTTDGLLFGYTEVLDSENSIYQVSFWIYTGTTIVWAALYEGSYTAETLPEYQPKGYGVELLECKRYFQKYQDIGFTVRNNGQVSYMLPVEMRTTPTFSHGRKSIYTGSSIDVSGNYPDWEPILYPSIIAIMNNVYDGYATLQFSNIELNADL